MLKELLRQKTQDKEKLYRKKNKTKKQKPTSEGNTELKISHGVETMPELVLHV